MRYLYKGRYGEEQPEEAKNSKWDIDVLSILERGRFTDMVNKALRNSLNSGFNEPIGGGSKKDISAELKQRYDYSNRPRRIQL